MRCVSQSSVGVLFLAAISASAAEQPLGPGYFKWLLHLGQNPSDKKYFVHGSFSSSILKAGITFSIQSTSYKLKKQLLTLLHEPIVAVFFSSWSLPFHSCRIRDSGRGSHSVHCRQ